MAAAEHMVQLRPELFAAYVGTGQVSSWAASVNAQFDRQQCCCWRPRSERMHKRRQGKSPEYCLSTTPAGVPARTHTPYQIG